MSKIIIDRGEIQQRRNQYQAEYEASKPGERMWRNTLSTMIKELDFVLSLSTPAESVIKDDDEEKEMMLLIHNSSQLIVEIINLGEDHPLRKSKHFIELQKIFGHLEKPIIL